MLSDERETEVTELLEAFVPNLLSERKYEVFVANLFRSERGRWLSAEQLCPKVDDVDDFFRRLAGLVKRELLVVWLDHPDAEGEYSYVHFYLEDYFWTTSAIYNLRLLSREVSDE
ncbi:hypothetical protein [Limnoglobus roseus]|uniref:hypothetical protein n=1 Tax=Limnoglobus roseus TaxID=2598579 RepID=UPI0011EADE4D|nr:hypothetical protein [Limnoglobus roseus]